MRFSNVFFAAALAALPLMAAACGSDSSSDSPGGSGSGGSGATGGGNTGGASGSGTGGQAGGSTGGAAGSGGGTSCDLTTDKTEAILEGDLNADMTLTADKTWLLKGTVRVNDGATLKIEPCTKIKGDKASLGTIVVERGDHQGRDALTIDLSGEIRSTTINGTFSGTSLVDIASGFVLDAEVTVTLNLPVQNRHAVVSVDMAFATDL